MLHHPPLALLYCLFCCAIMLVIDLPDSKGNLWPWALLSSRVQKKKTKKIKLGLKYMYYTAKKICITQQRKTPLCIPLLGIARPQSQFLHSCVCERCTYSHDPSTCFAVRRSAMIYFQVELSEFLCGGWGWNFKNINGYI
jgi:hypothetical protein